jgi:hypothetical protein
MPFIAVLWLVVQWLLRAVVVKFVVMAAIFFVVSELMPLVISKVASFVSPTGLTGAFSGIPSGVWYFLDFFALDIGLPLIIAAYIARFLIRRIPVIG